MFLLTYLQHWFCVANSYILAKQLMQPNAVRYELSVCVCCCSEAVKKRCSTEMGIISADLKSLTTRMRKLRDCMSLLMVNSLCSLKNVLLHDTSQYIYLPFIL